MYIKLGDSVARVVSINTTDLTTTLAVKNQDGITAVLDNIKTEIRLYNDEACTELTAIYKAEKIVKVSYEPEKRMVTLVAQTSPVSDMDTADLKEELRQQTEKIATLEDELAAAKILLGINEVGE